MDTRQNAMPMNQQRYQNREGGDAISEEEMEVLSRCQSYSYKKKIKSIGQIMIAAMIELTILVIVGVIAIIKLGSIGNIIFYVCLLAFLAYIIFGQSGDRRCALTQYFRDENGVFYQVFFTQSASMMAGSFHRLIPGGIVLDLIAIQQKYKTSIKNEQKAQETYPAFYYIQRYKRGIKDWDAFSGGPVKIKCLYGLSLIKKGKKSNTYSYQVKDHRKTIKISYYYEGLDVAAR